MNKELKDEIEDYWVCSRCEHDSLGDLMCPCPRGSCDAICMGQVVTKKTILYNATKWHAQFLESEDLYYLSELHPLEGLMTELFFDNEEDLFGYLLQNGIKLADSE